MNWPNRITTVAALALTLVVFVPQSIAAAEASSKKAKPPANLSVTTEILDVDSGGQPSTIKSDGGGVYQDNVEGVSSILTANVCNGLAWGDWRFDSQNSATRSVDEGFFAADLAVPGTAIAPWEGYKAQSSWMNVQCTCTAGENMYTMAQGATIICPLLNNFVEADSGFSWGYSPGKSFTGFTETTDAQITCNSAPAGHCVDWFIDPVGAPFTPAIARGVETVPGRPHPVKVNHGSYNMRFRIHVTLQ